MENGAENRGEEEEAIPRAYVCGCGKCSVKLNWGSESFSTSSPQMAAAYYRAMRKDLRFLKTELCLWGDEAPTRTQDKKNAIKAFHRCPIILAFLDQYEDWKKAVKEVRDEIKSVAEPETILVCVENWNGEMGTIELYGNAYVGTLRSKMREKFGMGYDANKAIYFGTKKLDYMKSMDYYEIVNGSVLKVR